MTPCTHVCSTIDVTDLTCSEMTISWTFFCLLSYLQNVLADLGSVKSKSTERTMLNNVIVINLTACHCLIWQVNFSCRQVEISVQLVHGQVEKIQNSTPWIPFFKIQPYMYLTNGYGANILTDFHRLRCKRWTTTNVQNHNLTLSSRKLLPFVYMQNRHRN